MPYYRLNTMDELSEELPHYSERQLRIGRLQRKAADFLTRGRTFASGVIVGFTLGAAEINMPEGLRALEHFPYKSWALGALTLGVVATDKGDGMLARASEKNGIPITDEDKKRDPWHDKLSMHGLMAGYWTRELYESYIHKDAGRAVGALGSAACQLSFAVRDIKMGRSRNNAVEGAEVGAITINKYKSAALGGALALAMSPAPNIIPQIAIAASNVAGWVGYRIADKVHRGEPYQSFGNSLQNLLRPPQIPDVAQASGTIPLHSEVQA